MRIDSWYVKNAGLRGARRSASFELWKPMTRRPEDVLDSYPDEAVATCDENDVRRIVPWVVWVSRVGGAQKGERRLY